MKITGYLTQALWNLMFGFFLWKLVTKDQVYGMVIFILAIDIFLSLIFTGYVYELGKKLEAKGERKPHV